MDDFLLAARRFADVAQRRINLIDLGLALFLEFFSWPMLLWCTSYVRLARRQLLPTLASEFRVWLTEHRPATVLLKPPTDDDHALMIAWAKMLQDDQSPILELIGRGLNQRWLLRRGEMQRANRVAWIALLCAIVVHGLIGLAVVTSDAIIGLLAGWLCAMAFAMLVCVSNRHWSPSAGFRRASR